MVKKPGSTSIFHSPHEQYTLLIERSLFVGKSLGQVGGLLHAIQFLGERFSVSRAVVGKFVRQHRKLGTLEPQVHLRGRKPAIQELDYFLELPPPKPIPEAEERFKR